MSDKTKKSKKKIVVIALAVVVLLALVALGVNRAFFQKQSFIGAQAQPGDTVIIRINAGQVNNLYGYQFKLAFDESIMEYTGIQSSIEEIGWIFQRPFEDYILVGATQVGDVPGYNAAANSPICEIVMTINSESPIGGVTISEVNVVTMVESELEYSEGVEDWSYEIVRA